MLPSAINLVPAIVSVCKQYNWRHVAIIGQDENLFTKVCMYVMSSSTYSNIACIVISLVQEKTHSLHYKICVIVYNIVLNSIL